MTEGRLVLSSNRGRYAIDDANEGPDLSSGRRLEIFLGGQWTPGLIEYNPDPIYATLGPQTLADVAKFKEQRPAAIGGYYFIADTGEICGLCVGMEVRLR